MSTVIKVENLSKRYRLGVINRDMLYKDLQSRWAKFRGKEDPNAPIGLKHDKRLEHGDEFWALRNVDLEVKEGEILGIIGRNGAGKSTLLKILSQITAPTEGKIKVKGRIASLLEVGTGFHPELTGRENVYLNGAILGMTRKEVASKFDEIVTFSDIEEFIDTPVKRYSSGMYVRLAFAVAAHLDPDVLIVDEVLAVGDAAFQKKCVRKMSSIVGQGRTVIIVTHSMALAESLTGVCAWLDQGQLKQLGDTKNVIKNYLEAGRHFEITETDGLHDHRLRRGQGHVRFISVQTHDRHGQTCSRFARGEAITFKMRFKVFKDCPSLGISLHLQLGVGSALRLDSPFAMVSPEPLAAGSIIEYDLSIDTTSIPAAIYDIFVWIAPMTYMPNEFYDALDGFLPPLEIAESTNERETYTKLSVTHCGNTRIVTASQPKTQQLP